MEKEAHLLTLNDIGHFVEIGLHGSKQDPWHHGRQLVWIEFNPEQDDPDKFNYETDIEPGYITCTLGNVPIPGKTAKGDVWVVFVGDFGVVANTKYYGQYWRCWDNLPTIEQTEATPWERRSD